jgi:3-oxoacyl-[acyl-carrier protein] reductase
MDLAKRRVALVTGSSRGLGRAIAQRLARDGLAVAVNGIDEDETFQVAAAIRGDGGTAEAFIADVTDEGQAAGLVTAIATRLGPVSVLVLNATGPQPTAPLAEVTWPDHLAMLEFFVKSPVLVGRAALPAKGLARAWARELAHLGITVNSVAPGFIPVERHADLPPQVLADYLATVPAGHMGTPDDIAHAVSFFASEGAGFITGQRIVVDGGRSLGG